MKIDILPNYFLNSDGTFNKKDAINLCGKIAGICYDKEGFSHLVNEKESKTLRRVDMTLNNGHHSVYDHVYINFNIQNIPKILAMVINNEKEYTTSEKSLRYTPVVNKDGSVISKAEEELYNKWKMILFDKIKGVYGDIYNDKKIEKLAQENARYFVTVFMPTEMIYTTSLRQINYIVSFMKRYVLECDKSSLFNQRLVSSMNEFISELDRLNVLEDGLLKNEKCRKLSLFDNDIDKKEEYYGDIYLTKYNATLACLAQGQRHRTLSYSMKFMEEDKYFVPPIIMDDALMISEWLNDMDKVRDVTPQGKIVTILEEGSYDNFILKCKERLCNEAQLEIMMQTRNTLLKYKEELEKKEHYLKEDIKNYTKGARCTFNDFTCTKDCGNKEGKTLKRKI